MPYQIQPSTPKHVQTRPGDGLRLSIRSVYPWGRVLPSPSRKTPTPARQCHPQHVETTRYAFPTVKAPQIPVCAGGDRHYVDRKRNDESIIVTMLISSLLRILWQASGATFPVGGAKSLSPCCSLLDSSVSTTRQNYINKSFSSSKEENPGHVQATCEAPNFRSVHSTWSFW
jgi:hypothetical protein